MKCKYKESCGYDICLEGDCGKFEPAQETNGDRIRAMSDEELGEFLCGLMGGCGTCPATDHCFFEKFGMVEWIKLPAKEEDNERI